MSLFHKYRDVYFDAVQLADALEQIPEACDGCDPDAHLAGRCDCTAGGTVKAPRRVEQGCLYHLQNLREWLHWLEEDLRRLKISRVADAEPHELEKLLSLINWAYFMTASINRLEQAIEEFRLSCAHEDLCRLREVGWEVRNWAAQLNALL